MKNVQVGNTGPAQKWRQGTGTQWGGANTKDSGTFKTKGGGFKASQTKLSTRREVKDGTTVALPKLEKAAAVRRSQ